MRSFTDIDTRQNLKPGRFYTNPSTGTIYVLGSAYFTNQEGIPIDLTTTHEGPKGVYKEIKNPRVCLTALRNDVAKKNLLAASIDLKLSQLEQIS